MAVINDEKLGSEEKLLNDDIAEDALNSMRFLPEKSPAPSRPVWRGLRRRRGRTGRTAFPEE